MQGKQMQGWTAIFLFLKTCLRLVLNHHLREFWFFKSLCLRSRFIGFVVSTLVPPELSQLDLDSWLIWGWNSFHKVSEFPQSPKKEIPCSSNSLLGETRDPRSRLMVSLISLVSLIGTELETCQSYAQNTATISRVYALPNIWGNRRNKAYVGGTWAKPFYEVCMKKTQFPST